MIYLDNNATTPIAPEVAEAMRPFLTEGYGNPSSAYSIGRESRGAVDAARASVAALIGARDSEIYFTSGGTESDNWAIRGALAAQGDKRHIVTTRVEHEAVRKLSEQLATEGFEVSWLDVDEQGHLDLDQLRSSLRTDTAIVSVMLANNETGVIFPVDAVAQTVKELSNALMHVDAVNAAGKVAIDVGMTEIDLLSISAHKFHGPKGVGALYARDVVNLPAFAIGGGQESGRRAGTEAVHQIVGLGSAAEFVSDLSAMESVAALRDLLEAEILRRIPSASVNGASDAGSRVPNTTNISFENLNGEMILSRLDDAGICVSTGSACHAQDHKTSPVLEAMNIPFSKAMGSIRFSLGRFNTEAEVMTAVEAVEKIVGELRTMSGVAG